jgi:hypothetical protein
VVYASSSSALATGSALTFDGTTLANSIGGGTGFRLTASSGTSSIRQQFVSTGGTFSVGLDSSTGSIFTAAYAGIIWHDGNYPLVFGVNNAEALRLTSSSLYTASGINVGIGTSSPTAKLQIGDSTVATANRLVFGKAVASSESFLPAIGQQSFDGNGNDLALAATSTSGVVRFYTGASTNSGEIGTGSNTEKMRLDTSGRLNIGATSNNYGAVLELTTSNGLVSYHNSTATNGAYSSWFNSGLGNGYIGAAAQIASGSASDFAIRAQNALVFTSGGGSERARIDSSGNLLVGTTDSSATSGVGTKLISNGQYYGVMSGSTNADTTFQLYSTGAGAYRFYVGLGGTVYATSTTISAISDIRFKENVRDLDVGLNAVMALKPRLYDWKEGKGANIKNARGFIAQEFEEVFPDLIDEWKDPAPEGEEPYKSVRQDLIPVLVKAIQELKAEFDAYKASHP